MNEENLTKEFAAAKEKYASEIKSFHLYWDNFTGPARLLTREHLILAVNEAAKEKGFNEGGLCSRVPSKENHRACKLDRCFEDGTCAFDQVSEGKVRCWTVLKDTDLVVHFTVTVPEME